MTLDLRGFHLSVKKDGRTAEREMFGAVFVGEQMKSGHFWAIDVKRIGEQNVCKLTKRERWKAMQEFSERGLLIVPSGFSNEFAEAVAADSSIEGFCGQAWDAPFGYDIFKWKRQQTFDVRVTEKLRGAIAISYEGQDAGKCALAGRNLDLVRVGDCVEIAAQCRNASGKFREARPVLDESGRIKIRHDKMEASQ